MLPLYTSEEMRALDRRAITELGIPGIVLMENAAAALLTHIAEEYGSPEDLSVAIFCGPGNNGGDGFALARQLFLRGADVEVFLLSNADSLTGDARLNYEICRTLDVPLYELESADDLEFQWYDLVVDAIFGTGSVRTPEGVFREVITAINESEVPVLAVDVPSGLDASSGDAAGAVIHAATTVTFQCGKPGLYLEGGRSCAGEVKIAPISLPVSEEDMIAAKWYLPEAADAAALFAARPLESHKGSFGRLLLLAGSRGMSGAARLAAQAALRSGVGLLKVGVPESIRGDVITQPEAQVIGLAETAGGTLSVGATARVRELIDWADAIAAGPGWGTDPETVEILRLLFASGKPLVLDADALNLIAAHGLLGDVPAGAVLTPHPGEFVRLSARGSESIGARIAAARELSARHKIVLHIKSSSSVTVAPDGRAYVNSTGNPGLATGGSGDVLTGLVGSLLAQGVPGVQAAWGGAFILGLAADEAVAEIGEVSLLPSDVVEFLPFALQDLSDGGYEG
ncbi:MAG: NAD(P)H-hydrate dehydratase [Calditrichaeota bacterium]|nr:NAD(P)H-hydrate dehydratase [Calditrichota bacterium]MCB9391374.1 NAD(P)H-hydrate dehydratase [Calditrichota bacterium]